MWMETPRGQPPRMIASPSNHAMSCFVIASQSSLVAKKKCRTLMAVFTAAGGVTRSLHPVSCSVNAPVHQRQSADSTARITLGYVLLTLINASVSPFLCDGAWMDSP